MALQREACVVHYPHLAIEKQNLTALTKETHTRLIQSRDARLRLGGAYYHKEQTENIPERFTEGEHYIHRQCYQNFTKAISILAQRETRGKKKIATRSSPLKRKKRSREPAGTLFPDTCMKCKSSGPIKVKGKKQFLRTLQTHSACNTLQRAATLRNDEEMLLSILGEDLIAKEFKMHPDCYRDYTVVCSKQTAKFDASAEENGEEEVSRKTDFEPVKDFIVRQVLEGRQSVSIKVLTELYGFDNEDSRLRSKVKQKIEREFGDKIIFLSVSYHEAQIVTSRSSLDDTNVGKFIKGSKEFILKEAARLIRKDLCEVIEQAPELQWPPTPDSLSAENRQPPASVREFILNVLHVTAHTPGEDVCRYAYSFSQDLLHAVSKGNFLTEKHVLLGTGLHSMTGQKAPIRLLGKFGHSCNYDKVRQIETAQAELAQQLRYVDNPLPLLPVNGTSKVLTFFWWDNFDVKKENSQGSLHTTHGIAYLEEAPGCIETLLDKSVPR